MRPPRPAYCPQEVCSAGARPLPQPPPPPPPPQPPTAPRHSTVPSLLLTPLLVLCCASAPAPGAAFDMTECAERFYLSRADFGSVGDSVGIKDKTVGITTCFVLNCRTSAGDFLDATLVPMHVGVNICRRVSIDPGTALRGNTLLMNRFFCDGDRYRVSTYRVAYGGNALGSTDDNWRTLLVYDMVKMNLAGGSFMSLACGAATPASSPLPSLDVRATISVRPSAMCLDGTCEWHCAAVNVASYRSAAFVTGCTDIFTCVPPTASEQIWILLQYGVCGVPPVLPQPTPVIATPAPLALPTATLLPYAPPDGTPTATATATTVSLSAVGGGDDGGSGGGPDVLTPFYATGGDFVDAVLGTPAPTDQYGQPTPAPGSGQPGGGGGGSEATAVPGSGGEPPPQPQPPPPRQPPSADGETASPFLFVVLGLPVAAAVAQLCVALFDREEASGYADPGVDLDGVRPLGLSDGGVAGEPPADAAEEASVTPPQTAGSPERGQQPTPPPLAPLIG
eukprot:Rhum_TRINITY_DN14889_c14_g1::Rhum_TRINITY_DN14889_c14_g1_i1::g.126432::m.126432